MGRFTVLVALTFGSISILLACLIGGTTAGLVFGFLAIGFPVLLMLLGVCNPDGRMGPAARSILVLWLLLEAALAGMWAARGTVEGGIWILGLPLGAAIQIYGIFILPLVLVTLTFALTFDSFGVDPTELDDLRALASDEADG